MVAENVKNIRQRIASACAHAGRTPEEVTLIAVTKTFNHLRVKEALDAGVIDIGENYVQEAREKQELLQDEQIRWHFIGHLQSNKVKYIIPWVSFVHAVDSLKLGEELSRQAAKTGREIDVLVEVNTSAESTKFGVQPDETRLLVKELSTLSNINVAGLMTIGPFLPDPELSRPAFRMLCELREECRQDGFNLPHLSMGMTNDFEVAIEEGATMVRIGTAIFGKRTNIN
jgi:pyridoxal phosphate enzyme (YggS family)